MVNSKWSVGVVALLDNLNSELRFCQPCETRWTAQEEVRIMISPNHDALSQV